MRVDNELTFQKIHPLHPEVAEVIALSIGFPGLEKVKEVLKEYTHANRTLMGSFFSTKVSRDYRHRTCGHNGYY